LILLTFFVFPNMSATLLNISRSESPNLLVSTDNAQTIRTIEQLGIAVLELEQCLLLQINKLKVLIEGFHPIGEFPDTVTQTTEVATKGPEQETVRGDLYLSPILETIPDLERAKNPRPVTTKVCSIEQRKSSNSKLEVSVPISNHCLPTEVFPVAKSPRREPSKRKLSKHSNKPQFQRDLNNIPYGILREERDDWKNPEENTKTCNPKVKSQGDCKDIEGKLLERPFIRNLESGRMGEPSYSDSWNFIRRGDLKSMDRLSNSGWEYDDYPPLVRSRLRGSFSRPSLISLRTLEEGTLSISSKQSQWPGKSPASSVKVLDRAKLGSSSGKDDAERKQREDFDIVRGFSFSLPERTPSFDVLRKKSSSPVL